MRAMAPTGTPVQTGSEVRPVKGVGLRSNVAKRKEVDVALRRKKNESLSDRKVADLCGAYHRFVRTRRERLSACGDIKPESKAHASHQRYKVAWDADARPLSLLGDLSPAVARSMRVGGARTLGDVAAMLAKTGGFAGMCDGLSEADRTDLKRRLARAAKKRPKR